MTHPNRPLHRRDVEAGVIDNNPYPQDLKPEELEIGKAIDLLTKPVINETEGGAVLEDARELKYPSFSLHGKTGNFTVDRDGTYRLVNCTVSSLTFETPATVILINTRVGSVTGEINGSGLSDNAQIRLIFVDSVLGAVRDSKHFFISLHGRSTWNGGMENCRYGNVRMLQNRDWTAADNLKNCDDIVMSFAMTEGARVVPVGDFFALRSSRIRLHWHHTDLAYSNAEGILFNECKDILSQHHGSNVRAGKHLAFKSERIGVVLHSCALVTVEWIYHQTEQPLLSAISSTINTEHPSKGGVFKSCNNQRVNLGNKTACNTGSVLTGEGGVFALSKSKVKAASNLIDATNAVVSVTHGELLSEGGDSAVTLVESKFTTDHAQLLSSTVGCDMTDCVLELNNGRIQGNSGALKLENCSTRSKLVKLSSSGMDISMKDGSLTVEGGTMAQSLEVKDAAHVKLSDVDVGQNLLIANTAAVELYGNEVGGYINATGGNYQSGGNTFGSTGTLDFGFGTLGGDSFGGALHVIGVFMMGNVTAPDVTNAGFMLLEGGSGSSHLPVTKRGWHVTESMDWTIDTDLHQSVGNNMNVNVGTVLTQTAGELIANHAPDITDN